MRNRTHLLLTILALLAVLGALAPSCQGNPPPPDASLLPAMTRSSALASTPAPALTASPEPTAAPKTLTVRLESDFGLEDFPADGALRFVFNQPVNPDSAEPLLLAYPDVRGELTWNADHTTLAFRPASRFEPALEYRLFINSALISASGIPLTGQGIWTLRTRPAPRVVSISASYQKLGAGNTCPCDWHTRVRFSRAMDQASIQAAISFRPASSFEITWLDERECDITFTAGHSPGKHHTLIISTAALDVSGVPLDAEWQREWPEPPLLSGISGPTSQNIQTPLRFAFNYSLDQDHFIHNTELLAPDGKPLPGTWNWLSANTVVFQPDAALDYSTTYSLQFTQPPQMPDGAILEIAAPVTYESPLPILDHTPGIDERIDPTGDLTIDFAIPVNQGSVEGSFTILPATSGEITWQEDTLTFTPEHGWEKWTIYQVILETGALRLDGRPLLPAPYSWSFRSTTDGSDYGSSGLSTEPQVSAGEYGPRAQVLDLDGRRAVQFLAFNTGQVQHELYRLALEQFLARCSTVFSSDREISSSSISIAGAALQARWQQPIGRRGLGYQGGIFETTIPEDVPAGLYVLQMSTGESQVQFLIVLTRNAIMLKSARDQVSAWVSDIHGDSRPLARLSVFDVEGQRLAQGRADSSGVFTARLDPETEPFIVIAEDSQALTGREITGTDITIAGLGYQWNTDYARYYWWSNEGEMASFSAHIHTDRPVYRPGQRVFFKAILRLDDDAELSLPKPGTPVSLEVQDARRNTLQTYALATNEFGSVFGEFQIAEGAMTGSYYVALAMQEEEFYQRFEVQDYALPDYEVSISTDASRYTVGDTITAEVQATYYFGQPVPGKKLTARFYDLIPIYYGYNDAPEPEYPEYLWEPVGKASIHSLDDQGHYTLEIPAPKPDPDSSYHRYSNQRERTIGLEVTVEDKYTQPVSSFTVITVSPSAEKMELDVGDYLQQVEQEFVVTARQVDINLQPIPGRKIDVLVRRRSDRYGSFNRTFLDFEVVADELGIARIPLTIDEPGYYQVRITGRDPRGYPIYTSDWLYVISPQAGGEFLNSELLRVSSERTSYIPGETARLVIESSFSGNALLTLERGRMRRSLPLQVTAPVTVFDLPVLPEDAPNVFVTVNAWERPDTNLDDYEGEYTFYSLRDAVLHTSSIELRVPVQGKRLNVEIKPDKQVYAPGDPATIRVQVSGEDGQPLQAELSLAVVDEAIYAISRELSPPLFGAFYGPRDNYVRTYDSLALERLLYEAGGNGGGGDDGERVMRNRYPNTAAWYPAIVTNEQGIAEIKLTLPGNLTTWRLTARAQTIDHRFGQSVETILVQKQVSLRPTLPRILTQDDLLPLSFQVRNDSAVPVALQLSLSSVMSPTIDGTPAFELLSPLTQTVELAANSAAEIAWQARSLRGGQALVTVIARSIDASPQQVVDAVQLPIDIQPLIVHDLSSYAGQFNESVAFQHPIPQFALESSTVEIELSRTIAGSLLDGLAYVTGYPYGCVEQTMSRLVPNAVAGRAFHLLGADAPRLLNELPEMINAGLQRLYAYQHIDGGWGWWYDDQTDSYMTAWVVFGLATTAGAGYEVDPDVIARGASYLLDEMPNMDVRTQSYAAYSLALAGYADLDQALLLFKRRQQLDAFTLAALALALDELGADTEAASILDELAQTAEQEDGLVYWSLRSEDGHGENLVMASTLRSTALALQAFVRIQPGHPLEPGMVRYLMSRRKPAGWGSTNETSYTILALTDHLLSVEDISAAAPFEILVDGQSAASGILTRNEPIARLELPIALFKSRSSASIELRAGSGGNLYYHITSRMQFAQEKLPAAGSVHVQRDYLDAVTGEQLTSFIPGQLVQVQIAVELDRQVPFFLVEDHLPAGLEALNERLNYSSHPPEAEDYWDVYFWEEYGYNYKEIRTGRVTFFITSLHPAVSVFTYLARAIRPGEFTALPAEAYAMYDEDVWGRSETLRISVAPRAE